jgi:hypothetical protein
VTNRMSTEPEKPTRRPPIGCIALVVVLVIGLALVGVSIFRLNAMVTDYQSRFQGDDWTTLEGKIIDQDTPITSQTLVFGGDITLHGATTDIAILGGDAVLHGHYDGTVYFLGKTFDVAPDATIAGTLSITAARHVTIRGTVEGKIEGNWDRIFGGQVEGTTPAATP